MKLFFTGATLGLVLKVLATGIALGFCWSTIKLSFVVINSGLSGWIPCFAWFLAALSLNSFNEELVCRVFPIRNLSSAFAINPVVLVLITASIFSGMHFLIEEPRLLKFLYRFGFGTLAGVLFLRWASLWQIVGLHTGWNFVALVISDSNWRTGTLLTVNGLDGHVEEGLNCIVLLVSTAYFSNLMIRSKRSNRSANVVQFKTL